MIFSLAGKIRYLMDCYFKIHDLHLIVKVGDDPMMMCSASGDQIKQEQRMLNQKIDEAKDEYLDAATFTGGYRI